MKEIEFIKYLAKKFPVRKPVVKGIGDDCAIIDYTKDKYLLLTCDMIIEGTHFSPEAAPYGIGWKSVAINISDIAAMGGIPKYALISAGVPRRKGMRFLKGILKGVEAVCRKFNIQVVGGDTNKSEKTVINVTLTGEVEKKRLVTRSGGKTGDLIFMTGALGEGRVKHLDFTPRLREARILVKNFKINSMIDLSDGLSMDLNRIARASSVGAHVFKSLIPLSAISQPLEDALSTGEDFELLFTASLKESRKIIRRMGEKGDLPVTLIGEVMPKNKGVRIIDEKGKARPLRPMGFEHL